MELDTTAIFSVLWMSIFVLEIILFRNLRVDRLRHEMFKLRDELFLEAARGTIPFSHPAYHRLRATMNGFIRFAHRLAIWHFIITLFMSPNRGRDEARAANDEWDKSICDLDEQQREVINRYRHKMAVLVLGHFLATPPDMLFAWLGLISTFVWFLINGLLKRKFNHLVRNAITQTKNRFRGSGNTDELNRLAVMYTGT